MCKRRRGRVEGKGKEEREESRLMEERNLVRETGKVGMRRV